ncbi:Plug domain-containing protein [Niabella insulamsoli]|uniref:Plug domain-containing protein n=1 Tax=Niabella insulamsoli TaxID=3144874 RepID=UPI0031FCDFE1
MKIYVLTIWFILSFWDVRAQFDAFQSRVEQHDSLQIFDGRERIFIHTDRQQYQINDTLWLKGYLVAGAYNMVNDSSRISYIELIDAEGALVKRISAYCYMGMFYSNLTLTDQLFHQGTYTLRAYTNRLRNFGDTLFYKTDIRIIDPAAALWKASVRQISFDNNRLFIAAGLRSENLTPIANSKVLVRLRSRSGRLFRREMVTDGEGNIYIDTVLKDPRSGENLTLTIQNKNLDIQVPVATNRKNFDLQFLPEGGSFISGFRQRLAFKAVDLYGKGVDVSGWIEDGSGHIVDSFASLFKGMGYLWITPRADQIYTAVMHDGARIPLPAVESSGQMLRVSWNDAQDSIVVTLNISAHKAKTPFFMTGATRGLSFMKARLKGRPHYEIKLAAADFPSGVARFTVYDEKGWPLNEQAFFVWHPEDHLNLTVRPNRPFYGNKDSVSLSIAAANAAGAGVSGSFSIAVVDSGQVASDPDRGNIMSYMLLSSELRGKVEQPGYYLKYPKAEATQALMLTQGWVRYSLDDTPKTFPYERSFSITGSVTNIFNKPSPRTKVTIFGRQGQSGGFFFADTLTNDAGQFSFNDFQAFLSDSISMLIKAVNKKEKSFGIGVEVAEQSFPALPEVADVFNPGQIIFDTTLTKAIDRRTEIMNQLKRDGRMLDEVIVTAKAKIVGSKNLNEDGGADQTITQAILEKTPKQSLLQVLGDQIGGFPMTRGAPFAIGKARIYIVIDGLDLAFFEMNPFDVLQYYSAEDVKGIEVMRSMRYVSAYAFKFLHPMEVDMLTPPIFIEITTFGGVGPFLKKVPGIYYLKPMAPFVGKQFYSPRYPSKEEENIFPDLRQTVYWNPDLITNEEGRAEVSFYTTESKSSYLIIIHGTDLKGRFGTVTLPLSIKPD